jgi:hypothetical protein
LHDAVQHRPSQSFLQNAAKHHLCGTTIRYGYVSTSGLVEGCTVTYADADVFMLGQNTNKSPLQELPWPSKLTPKDDLPEMDACREILEKGLAYMSAVKNSRQVVQT